MTPVIATDTDLKGLKVRPPTMADLEEAQSLEALCEKANTGETGESTLEGLRTAWQEPKFNLQTDAWLVIGPDEQIVAMAAIWNHENVQLYTDLVVHPEYRERGIGTFLLHKLEERGRQLAADAPEGVRVVLNRGTVSTNQPAHQLLEQEGFQLVRHFYRMVIDMEAMPPLPQLPPNLQIRTFVPGQDDYATYQTDEDVFRDHWGFVPGTFERWQHWTVKSEDFDPSLWFLAVEGDKIAGISLCTNRMPTMGWVDTLGVRREWRKSGVGLALLHHSFREFYRRGKTRVGLGVDASSLTGATRLYEKAGMHVQVQFDRFQKELRAGKDLSVQSLTD